MNPVPYQNSARTSGPPCNNRNSLILQSLMIFGRDSPLGYFRAFLRQALKHADSMAQSQVFQAGGQPRERLSERKRTRSATREVGIEWSKKYNCLWLRSFRIFERDRRGSVSHAPVYAAAGLGLLLAGTMKPLLKRFCMIVVLVFGCVAPRLMP